MTTRQDKPPPGLHIEKMAGDWVKFSFNNAHGAAVFDVTVSGDDLSDAERKSLALGKLARIMEDLHAIMKDDNSSV